MWFFEEKCCFKKIANLRLISSHVTHMLFISYYTRVTVFKFAEWTWTRGWRSHSSGGFSVCVVLAHFGGGGLLFSQCFCVIIIILQYQLSLWSSLHCWLTSNNDPLTCFYIHTKLVCIRKSQSQSFSVGWEVTENGITCSVPVISSLSWFDVSTNIYIFFLSLRKFNTNQNMCQQNVGLFINKTNKTIEPGFRKTVKDIFVTILVLVKRLKDSYFRKKVLRDKSTRRECAYYYCSLL